MVERIDRASPFDLQEYYDHPELYRGQFAQYVPHLTVLMVGIYWEVKYPRLVTYDLLREMYGGQEQPRLRVIGDISCDIEGSVQCTQRVTESDDPVYVYEPKTGQTPSGVAGDGPVILAVDHLPCELPVDSSAYFSRSLRPLIPGLSKADFGAPFANCGLPPELVRATIVYQGSLTEPYRYLEEYLNA
jgi:alpha-aminoadipic semialdehyde synthase